MKFLADVIEKLKDYPETGIGSRDDFALEMLAKSFIEMFSADNNIVRS